MQFSKPSTMSSLLGKSLAFGLVLLPASLIQAGNCDSCDGTCHHHQAKQCCPPGLLDHLNVVSDSVEARLKTLIPVRKKGCDDPGCDHCHASLQPVGHTHTEHTHHSSAPTHREIEFVDDASPSDEGNSWNQETPIATRHNHKPAKPKKPVSTRPTLITPEKDKPTQRPAKLPEWIDDPFKDEAANSRATNIRPASVRKSPSAMRLDFDPQANNSHKQAADRILSMATTKPAPKQGCACGKGHSTVAKSETSVERHVDLSEIPEPKPLEEVQVAVVNSKPRKSNAPTEDSDVIQASTFKPVYVAPIPRHD